MDVEKIDENRAGLMSSAIRIPQDDTAFYQELTTRNHHFISPEAQRKLGQVRILIAGCGATGGACVSALARVGVRNFTLTDNGRYELNNLNRQHASVIDLDRNKAEFHAERLRAINPFASVRVFSEGVSLLNVREMVATADFIVDAVDVTNAHSMAMKFEMHRVAHELKKPVVTGMDLGFCQWGTTFDYRKSGTPILGGHYERAKAARHPIRSLLEYVPLSAVPDHALHLIEDLLTDSDKPASQIGCASDLLSAIIVGVLVRFVETGELVKGWDYNLERLALSRSARLKYALRAPLLRLKIRRLLKKLP